jgi:hypothetical protein
MKNSAKRNRAPAPGDEFLTTEEAAKKLKRSTKTLEYWRLAGLGPPFYRQRRAIRYLANEVMAWGASRRVAPQNTGEPCPVGQLPQRRPSRRLIQVRTTPRIMTL